MKLDRFLGRGSEPLSSIDSSPYTNSPQSNLSNNERRVWTWTEVAEELINYSRKYGPVKSPEEKLDKIKGVRLFSPPHATLEKVKQVSTRQYWWGIGIKKGVPKDIMDGLPLEKLAKIVRNWPCPKTTVPEQTVPPSAPPVLQNFAVEPKNSLSQIPGAEPKHCSPEILDGEPKHTSLQPLRLEPKQLPSQGN